MMMLLLVVVSALLVCGFKVNETEVTRYLLNEVTEVYTSTKINTSETLSVKSFKTKGASWSQLCIEFLCVQRRGAIPRYYHHHRHNHVMSSCVVSYQHIIFTHCQSSTRIMYPLLQLSVCFF